MATSISVFHDWCQDQKLPGDPAVIYKVFKSERFSCANPGSPDGSVLLAAAMVGKRDHGVVSEGAINAVVTSAIELTDHPLELLPIETPIQIAVEACKRCVQAGFIGQQNGYLALTEAGFQRLAGYLRKMLSASESRQLLKAVEHEPPAQLKAVSPSAIAEMECGKVIREWVVARRRPKSVKALYEEIRRTLPRLSRRGFDRAWASAALPAWKKPGRKSPQRIDTQ